MVQEETSKKFLQPFKFSFLPESLQEMGYDLGEWFGSPSGLNISEDEHNVYLEAAMPGLEMKDIEITLEDNTLWIKGERKESESKRKYYRKTNYVYSYRVTLPKNVNDKQEPKATYNNGILEITFTKASVGKTKKIAVQKPVI